MSMVYLVGAGPGDPGLITVRGLACLSTADVVLYDHLVHPRLLRSAREDAELIDVGEAAPQPLEQEAICYLLAEKAREGKTVARLKWGDPFVFDRGGPEALFLHEQGVRFEVVPGVPAGVGIPGYAGVPVTYPGGGDTLTFIRGHEDGGNTKPRIDWTTLSKLDGSLVCYVGRDRLPEMIRDLLTHGKTPDEPAVVIYDGTLATQRTIGSTLGEIATAIKDDTEERRPAILVVGRTANLREHLRWFDARPLFGTRVLVTRPRDPAAELVDQLEMFGAEAIEAPMIRIVPPDDPTPLEQACARAHEFDWIVFASANAVDAFMEQLLDARDVRALGSVKLCSVGPATAERLADYGLKVDLTPTEYRADALVQAMTGTANMAGQKVLLPHADIGREIVADELRRHGADVTEVVAYRTVAAEAVSDGGQDIYRMLLEKRIDVVTFTSASAVRNFVAVVGTEQAPDLLHGTIVACIGPVTAEAARRLGIETAVMPAQYTIPAMVEAIAAYVAARAS